MSRPLNISRFAGLTRRLHRLGWLRQMAKRVARRLVLTQSFHGGVIAFNAVAHSWAWTGERSYEVFDRTLQDRLLALSLDRPHFLDVGANVGTMTLSVLLRNLRAHALAVEPGQEAAALLRQSLQLNRLEHRCELIEAAASTGAASLRFNASGSVMGHVADSGPKVPAVGLVELVDRVAEHGSFLVKIDVEGYETALIPVLAGLPAPAGSCAVIELHPAGFNGLGDPLRCVDLLRRQANLTLRSLGGQPLDTVAATDFTQLEVQWT